MNTLLPTIITWIKAARLRTLPLSFSGIITGTAIAFSKGYTDWNIFLFAMLCTLLFQVISNFANDYGDGIKGTDNQNRVGPKRVLQLGLLTPSALKKGIFWLSLLAIISVIVLLFLVFGIAQWPYFIIFLLLGILSIMAAIKYTVGENAYGYKGLGDIFVFVFFGLLSVLGSLFLYTKYLEPADILLAVVIGSLSVAVLNLNNLRDHINDAQSNKNTLIVKFGYHWGKKYHAVLIVTAFFTSFFYAYNFGKSPLNYLPLWVFVPLFIHLIKVVKTTNPSSLDPELKKVAILTFLWAISFFINLL